MIHPTHKSSSELLSIIFSYIERIAKESNLEHTLILCADLGRDLICADRCTVWMHNKKTATLWSKVAHGVDRIVIPDDAGIVGHVIQENTELIVNDPYNDPRFNKETDIKTGYLTRNIICLPIRDSEGVVIGAFQAINKTTAPHMFTETDKEHLKLASTYAGKQLEAVILQEELNNTQKEIIFTLAEVGEIRSKETGFHVKRVMEYTMALGRLAGLAGPEFDMLRNSSPLHDIGKIAIPDRVLLKPGKLNDEERKIMDTHTDIGWELLRHSERPIFKSAALIAYQHHEKWNGTGYPQKLKGEEIHIYGRLTAVADVFDALACKRCYKDAWPIDEVFNVFKEERGEHFDPKLTDLLLNNRDVFMKINDIYRDV